MTLDIEGITARAAAASPAPWTAITDNGRKNGVGVVGQAAKRGTGEAIAVFAAADSVQRNADAEFTAHARQDVPTLLGEIQRLRAEVSHFRDEWTIEGDSTWLWLGRILDGEQGCVLHSVATARSSSSGDPS